MLLQMVSSAVHCLWGSPVRFKTALVRMHMDAAFHAAKEA